MKVGDLVKDKHGHVGLVVNKVNSPGESRWLVWWQAINEFWDLQEYNLEVVDESR